MDVGALAVRHDPASAAVVRSAIAADLALSEIAADCADDVILVASELVGNALVHARASFGSDLAVSWDIDTDAVTVEVLDGSPVLPRPRASSDTETGGRGLAIVAAIADEWGARPMGRGKRVWARVPVTHTA